MSAPTDAIRNALDDCRSPKLHSAAVKELNELVAEHEAALAITSKQPRFDLKIYDTDQTERETVRYLTYIQLSAVSGALERMHVRHKIIPVAGTP